MICHNTLMKSMKQLLLFLEIEFIEIKKSLINLFHDLVTNLIWAFVVLMKFGLNL